METRKERLGQLDGLRGVAALAVVAHHYFLCFAPQMQPNRPTSPHWLFDTPLALFYNGGFALAIFFVVSGFVVANAGAARKSPLPVNIAVRYARLALPVTVSVIYAWALLTIFKGSIGEVMKLQPYGWQAQSYNETVPDLGFAIQQGLFGVFWNGSSLFNNPLWTMRTELLGSIFLYVIYAFTRGRVAIALVIAGCIGAYVIGEKQFIAFGLGALLREAWTARRMLATLALPAFAVGLILGAPLQRAYFRFHLQDIPFFGDLGVTLGLTAIAAAALLVYGVLASPLLQRAFSAPALLWLGRVSFMLYLVHAPLIFTIWSKLFVWAWPISGVELSLGLVLLLAASLALAWAGTKYVDEPITRGVNYVRKNYAAWLPLGRGKAGATGRG
jgi:peptidoglycan/LPS O-acetylase OafA/YrhL